MSHISSRSSFDSRTLQAVRRIAVVGAGTMGRTIATGLVRSGSVAAECLVIADRTSATAETLVHDLPGAITASNIEACSHADVILLCVKPKDVTGVLAELSNAHALEHGTILISIAAGVTISTIEQVAGQSVSVLRAMPNTPCLINRGMTVIGRGTHATEEHVQMAQAIFAPLGRYLTLDERHFDAVTALSASGPAFIYVVLEALADGGVMRGLPRDVATELAAQMTLGAAEMVLTTGKHPAALKDDVTTPGGCTIAGLLVLEDGRVRSVLARTVEETAQVAGGLGR